MPEILAHRGFTARARENTLEAFLEAGRIGADGVELDVRRSADGALVVHHDAEIEGLGPLSALRVRDLPPHVPLLPAVLEATAGLVLNVEIKNDPGEPGYESDQGLATAVAAAVAEADRGSDVVVSSFNPDTLAAVGRADPGLALGLLLAPGASGPGAGAGGVGRAPGAPGPGRGAGPRDRGFQGLHPFVLGLTAELVAEAHDAGLAVRTWTVNNPDDMVAVAALGVEALITDRPDEALARLRPG